MTDMFDTDTTYTPAQAAKILGVGYRRVQQMLNDGTLIGYQSETGRWSIPRDHVHQLKATRDRYPGRRRRRGPKLKSAPALEVVTLLKEELAAERAAHAETRRLVTTLVERIPPVQETPEENRRSA